MKNDTYDSYFYKALSEYMGRKRVLASRTVDEVAEIIGLPKTTFFQYESGHRKMPLSVFGKLCLLYNVKMNDAIKEIQENTLELINKEI